MGLKSKKQSQRPAATTTEKTTPSTPNWPPLRPLLPTTDLNLTPLVPDQIYLIHNFFPSTLCKNYVSFLSSLPLTTTPGKPKKDEAVRVNDRFQIEDARFAEMLWSGTAMKELVTTLFFEEEEEEEDRDTKDTPNKSAAHTDPDLGQRTSQQLWGGEPLGLNANIRIYRYSTGQFFAQHYDESNILTFTPSPSSSSSSSTTSPTKPTPARTTWTILIYLTTCAGGETVFYPEPTRADRNPAPIAVPPETGLALLHRHGDRCMLHEGKEVTDGEKWVLRSDLVVVR